MITIRNMVCASFIGCAFTVATTADVQAEETPKPNIVHILVDDLGWQDIASHKLEGEPVYETPHLDRMTRKGLRFTQAYSPAPSCAPSRVAFLRGQNAVNTRVYHVSGGVVPRPWQQNSSRICPYYPYGLSKDEPMIPEALKKAGYFSGHVAKWHAGGKSAGYPFPLDQGFDFGFTEMGGRHKYYNDTDLWNPEERTKNNFFGSWRRMSPDRLTDFATSDPTDPFQLNEDGRPFDKPQDLALGFIRKHKDKPFFLNYCPYYVHGPIQARDRKRFEHYLEKMGHPFPTDPNLVFKAIDGHTNPYYAVMVDTVDAMVGEIVTYLEETDDPRNPGHKLIDNTYVIVDSDNGGVLPYTNNSPLQGGKQNTWEGGIRIPFLVLGPGVPVGATCDTPINLIDLFPTFMSMAGLEPDESLELDGCDILPLIKGEADKAVNADGEVRESLFWYFPWDAHMSSAIRQGDWKLIRQYGAWMGANAKEGVHLFRLYGEDGSSLDLWEASDVGDQHPEVRDRLLAELDKHVADSGAPLPYRNPLSKKSDPELVAATPAVLEMGSEDDRVWVTLESGAGKAAIVEAQLLYTLNPKLFDSTNASREEWFEASTTISEGRIDAVMPPGATHAAFALRDENGFLIRSEAMPAVSDSEPHARDSTLLKNGFAYKPGLFALIQLGQQGQKSAEKAGMDVTALKKSLNEAKKAHRAVDASEETHCDAIRSLRSSIRDLQGTPEAAHALINRFPTEPLF